MNIVTREESVFAPFDLTKTRKFDRTTDKVQLAIKTYDLANNYYEAAKILIKKHIELMPVILTNISFSCELYLKALLYGYNTDFGNVHGLKDLFEKLPKSEQDYISQNIAIENRDKEFHLCLAEQNKAFVEYRYMNEVKAITAHPIFLFAFADILKFVSKSLIEEHSSPSEEDAK